MKLEFLKPLKVDNKYDAISMSFRASLQHNETYDNNASSQDKIMFKRALEGEAVKVAKMYSCPVTDDIHIDNMNAINLL